LDGWHGNLFRFTVSFNGGGGSVVPADVLAPPFGGYFGLTWMKNVASAVLVVSVGIA